MPLEYTGFNWPKRHQYIFVLPELTEADLPYYFTGNSTLALTPNEGRVFKVRRLRLNGQYAAAGTGVQLTATIYKGSVAAGNEAMKVTTLAENDADPFSRTSVTPENPTTGMDFIDDTDGYIGELALAAGDTFTLASGVLVMDVDFQ